MGSESSLTRQTRSALEAVVSKQCQDASNALHEGNMTGSLGQLEKAETNFRSAWSVSTCLLMSDFIPGDSVLTLQLTSPTLFSLSRRDRRPMAKLLRPDDPHSGIVMGLVDALHGLGREAEAKELMRSAGLARKHMQEAMPGSYQR